MHGAAYKNLPAVVQLLADKGAKIEVWNQKNKFGTSVDRGRSQVRKLQAIPRNHRCVPSRHDSGRRADHEFAVARGEC
ncbi:MAG: ankyrin repeat-containing protein [Bryobacterales bacterium]|nr:ankyrin repeat-containing protein [Bryobacterales bacterium]